MKNKKFFSMRNGSNPNTDGFGHEQLSELFCRMYVQLSEEGYFDESFGFFCVDEGDVPGTIKEIEYEILINLRKKNLWPIFECHQNYSEDDLFDIIEWLFEHVSKPIDGNYHSYSNCGMHWETFNRHEGKKVFTEKVNQLLSLYKEPFVLNDNGLILQKPEVGFEKIFEADVPTNDQKIINRLDSAILKFRRHGSTLDDRRQAVRDLADVIEYLRPQLKKLLSKKDEADLFKIANNFGIRHHNDIQKTDYDAPIWLSWMFYLYLSTIHVVLRKINLTK